MEWNIVSLKRRKCILAIRHSGASIELHTLAMSFFISDVHFHLHALNDRYSHRQMSHTYGISTWLLFYRSASDSPHSFEWSWQAASGDPRPKRDFADIELIAANSIVLLSLSHSCWALLHPSSWITQSFLLAFPMCTTRTTFTAINKSFSIFLNIPKIICLLYQL